MILVDLFLPGLAYAQTTLVFALTDEEAWSAANLVRVLATTMQGGWNFCRPGMVTGSFLALTGFLERCLEIFNEFVQAMGF